MPDDWFPAALAARFGLTRVPQPLNWPEVRAALRRGYAAALETRGMRRLEGSVLLSLTLDGAGRVADAIVLDPLEVAGEGDVRSIAVFDRGADLSPTLVHPAGPAPRVLQEIAIAAVRGARFHPAERDGIAVPVADYRLTVTFPPGPAA